MTSVLPRVAIDAQLTVGNGTGIGEYISTLVPALRACGLDIKECRFPQLDPWRFDRRVIWDQVLLPLSAAGADVLHCAAGTMPAIYRRPIVVTVHDVAWLRVQAHTRIYARRYFGAFMLEQYRRANRIVTVSEFSRDELRSLGGFDNVPIDVVYPSVDPEFFHLERSDNVIDYRNDGCGERDGKILLLVVGTVEKRKNLEVIIRALAVLRNTSDSLGRRISVIVIGRETPYAEECRNLADSLGVAQSITFCGYVNRGALLAYYVRAAIALVPSHYEGFGYAAAQALATGVPLIAARGSSLSEVVADASSLIDPSDADAWAESIANVLSNYEIHFKKAFERRLTEHHRFSPSIAAVEMTNVYCKAIGAHSS